MGIHASTLAPEFEVQVSVVMPPLKHGIVDLAAASGGGASGMKKGGRTSCPATLPPSAAPRAGIPVNKMDKFLQVALLAHRELHRDIQAVEEELMAAGKDGTMPTAMLQALRAMLQEMESKVDVHVGWAVVSPLAAGSGAAPPVLIKAGDMAGSVGEHAVTGPCRVYFIPRDVHEFKAEGFRFLHDFEVPAR